MRRFGVPLSLLAMTVTGCASAADVSDGGEFPRGWSEIATAPFAEGLRDFVSFWADDRLVVAGGYTSDEEEVAFSSATYVFDLGANAWAEGTPLDLAGFDGNYGGSGLWTGSQWVGQITGCRSGPLVGEDSVQQLPGRVDPGQLVSGWRLGQRADACGRGQPGTESALRRRSTRRGRGRRDTVRPRARCSGGAQADTAEVSERSAFNSQWLAVMGLTALLSGCGPPCGRQGSWGGS